MSNNSKKRNNQFKKNEQSGEHRNGRKSPFKNHAEDGNEPNEYLDQKSD
ncbi:hypothetical protein ACLIBH_06500 [Virgibacillus sp. W0430]